MESESRYAIIFKETVESKKKVGVVAREGSRVDYKGWIGALGKREATVLARKYGLTEAVYNMVSKWVPSVDGQDLSEVSHKVDALVKILEEAEGGE
jgi:hypothetical protein